jgi:hypothetical protein
VKQLACADELRRHIMKTRGNALDEVVAAELDNTELR